MSRKVPSCPKCGKRGANNAAGCNECRGVRSSITRTSSRDRALEEQAREEALGSNGFTEDGMKRARELWWAILPWVEQAEDAIRHPDSPGMVDEGEILSFVKLVTSSILARHRFAASIKAKAAAAKLRARKS